MAAVKCLITFGYTYVIVHLLQTSCNVHWKIYSSISSAFTLQQVTLYYRKIIGLSQTLTAFDRLYDENSLYSIIKLVLLQSGCKRISPLTLIYLFTKVKFFLPFPGDSINLNTMFHSLSVTLTL